MKPRSTTAPAMLWPDAENWKAISAQVDDYVVAKTVVAAFDTQRSLHACLPGLYLRARKTVRLHHEARGRRIGLALGRASRALLRGLSRLRQSLRGRRAAAPLSLTHAGDAR